MQCLFAYAPFCPVIRSVITTPRVSQPRRRKNTGDHGIRHLATQASGWTGFNSFPAMAASMSDEDWVALGAEDNEGWYSKMQETFGVDFRPVKVAQV